MLKPLVAILITSFISVDIQIVLQRVGLDSCYLHIYVLTDCVGPGINDNGSGTISILEVAEALTNFSVNNAVRFSWYCGHDPIFSTG